MAVLRIVVSVAALLLPGPAMADMPAPRAQALDRTLAALVADRAAPVSGATLVVLERGREVYAGAKGLAVIDPADPARQRPLDPDTPVRVASISKLALAITAMRLVEEGRLDLDRDVGEVLGFPVRNPHWPDRPITLRMLLTHTSSLRDGSVYALPVQHSLEELLRANGPFDADGTRWAKPEEGADKGPGAWFTYTNLNMGVLAAMVERATGERFDIVVERLLLEPLSVQGGLQAGFDVRRLPDPVFAKLAPVYRKLKGETPDPAGVWTATVDDHRGERPDGFVSPFGVKATQPLSAYQVGRNGTTLSPQGGLRISARGLTRIVQVLAGEGAVDGVRILKPETVAMMLAPAWEYRPERPNGDTDLGFYQRFGLGVHCSGSAPPGGAPGTGDGWRDGGGPLLCGHMGDAYGLLGGALFQPGGDLAFAYLITGTSLNSWDAPSPFSAISRWETSIGQAVLEGR